VTYTLSFHNTGRGAAQVDYTDHLADVLDDAELTGSPTASFGLLATGPIDGLLHVTGTVAPGATGTVTYVVTVRGHGRLTNLLTTIDTRPPDTCVPTDPLCTDNPVTEPPLAVTGAPALGLVSVALWAMLAGGWLLVAIRRRPGSRRD